MATNFWTKIAINAFIQETTGTWLLITGSFCGQPIWRRHFRFKVLMHFATATKFWPK